MGENQTDQLLWGAGAIGRAIQRSEAATSRLLRLGHLPATRVGDRWVASEARLRHFLGSEQSDGRQSAGGWMSDGSRADRWNKR
jgi:hypothetical protein